MEQRDPEKVRDAMRAHLEQVREDSRVSSSKLSAGKVSSAKIGPPSSRHTS
jgi:hypothetical protein